jgi:hypothetical protein
VSNRLYFEYKEKGLCRRCGRPPLEGKTRCKQCHKEHLGYQNRAKQKAIDQGLCRSCLTVPVESGASLCFSCLEAVRLRERNRYQLWRNACIEQYGGRCVCCGEDNQKYLQLDHVNNDGADHRREIANGRGGCLYSWAVKNNFSSRLQLLCANCHQAKSFHGGCTKEDHPMKVVENDR